MTEQPILRDPYASLECDHEKEGPNEKLITVTQSAADCHPGTEGYDYKKKKCCTSHCCKPCSCSQIDWKGIKERVSKLWSTITLLFAIYSTVQMFIPKVTYVSTVVSSDYVIAYGQNDEYGSNFTLWLDVKAFEDHFNVPIVNNNNSDYYYHYPLIIEPNNSWYDAIIPVDLSSKRPNLITFTRHVAPVSKSSNIPVTWTSLIFEMLMVGAIIPFLDKLGAEEEDKLKDEPCCTRMVGKARISIALMIWPLLWVLWSLPTNSFALDCPENCCIVNPIGISSNFIYSSAKFFWICWGIFLCTVCVRACIDEKACGECYCKCAIWICIGWIIGSLMGIYWKIQSAIHSAEVAYALGLYAIARFVRDWFADPRAAWSFLLKPCSK